MDTSQISSKHIYALSKSKKSGIYQVSFNVNGKRTRKSLKTKCADIAAQKAEALVAADLASSTTEITEVDYSDWIEKISPDKSKKNWLYRLYRQSVSRARKKDMDFSLTFDYLQFIALRSSGRCEVTNAPFNLNPSRDHRTDPFIPSLDRVNSEIGYTNENCRLVCYAANLGMSQWGEEPFKIMLAHYGRKYFHGE